MTKQKSTKKALLTSVLSLVLCMAMLIGTTFAWFTDSATSANNKIVAGNLDVALLMHNGTEYVDISEDEAPIFGTNSIATNSTNTLWEPGKTQVVYLAIKNNGNLDLKYEVALNVKNPAESKDLYKAMQYVITPNAKNGSVNTWIAANAQTVALGTQVVSATEVPLAKGATHYFALSVHMMETAGNEYQNGKIDFDITVLATQLASESDSFGKDYDALAGKLPVATVGTYALADTPGYGSATWGNFGGFTPDTTIDPNPKLETAYVFACQDTSEEAAESEYADWYCDFYVKLDRALEENQILLGGNYGSFGWIGFHNGTVTLDANQEIPLLGSVTGAWTYEEIASSVGTFICGVGDVDDALKGATFTVMLRLTNPANQGEFYNVATVNYKFQ